MSTRIAFLPQTRTFSHASLFYVLGVSFLFSIVFTSQGVPWFWRAPLASRIYAVFVAFLSVSILFLAASCRRWIFAFVLVASTATSAIAAYFVQTYGIHVNENTIGLFYETDVSEALGVMGPDLAGVTLVAIIVPMVFGSLLPGHGASESA